MNKPCGGVETEGPAFRDSLLVLVGEVTTVQKRR